MNGKRLKDARERAGYTQEDLANLAKISPRTLTRYEASHGAEDDSLASIARVLNVSVDYLLGLTDDPTPDAPLQPREMAVVSAMRRGDVVEAVRILVSG